MNTDELGKLKAMNTLFEANIGTAGLRLLIKEHADAPGEFLIDLQRHGLPESNCQTTTELRLMGEAIRLAAMKIGEELTLAEVLGMRVKMAIPGTLPTDAVAVALVPRQDGAIDLQRSVIFKSVNP